MNIGDGYYCLGRIGNRLSLEYLFSAVNAIYKRIDFPHKTIMPYARGLDIKNPSMASRDLWVHEATPCFAGWCAENRTADKSEREILEKCAITNSIILLPHSDERFLLDWSTDNISDDDLIMYLTSWQTALSINLTLSLMEKLSGELNESIGAEGHKAGLTPLFFTKAGWLKALQLWYSDPYKPIKSPLKSLPIDQCLALMEQHNCIVRFDNGYDIRTPFLIKEIGDINNARPEEIIRKFVDLGVTRTYTTKRGRKFQICFGERFILYGTEPFSPPENFADAWNRYLHEALLLKNYSGMAVAEKDVLEIGCGDGVKSLFFKRAGAKRVVATDMAPGIGAPYQRLVLSKWPANEDIIKRVDNTGPLPRFNIDGFSFISSVGEFMPFADASFDLVYSDQVLEHVRDPLACMKEMMRVLRKNGILFFRYNPYFHLSGGHGACNTDIPWAHIAMSCDEFEEYLTYSEFEGRAKVAVRSIQNYFTPKRMYMADFESYLEKISPIKILHYSSQFETRHSEKIDGELLAACREQYPELSIRDLLHGQVTVILRKL